MYYVRRRSNWPLKLSSSSSYGCRILPPGNNVTSKHPISPKLFLLAILRRGTIVLRGSLRCSAWRIFLPLSLSACCFYQVKLDCSGISLKFKGVSLVVRWFLMVKVFDNFNMIWSFSEICLWKTLFSCARVTWLSRASRSLE